MICHSTGFCLPFVSFVFKKILYEPFEFLKEYSTGFCPLLSLLCLKKLLHEPFEFLKIVLHGLLSPFVSFVFKKTAPRTF